MDIQVVLADDHPPTRQGVRTALEEASDVEVVAEAKDGVEAKELVADLRPDILLLDLGKSVLAFSRDARPQASRY